MNSRMEHTHANSMKTSQDVQTYVQTACFYSNLPSKNPFPAMYPIYLYRAIPFVSQELIVTSEKTNCQSFFFNPLQLPFSITKSSDILMSDWTLQFSGI